MPRDCPPVFTADLLGSATPCSTHEWTKTRVGTGETWPRSSAYVHMMKVT